MKIIGKKILPLLLSMVMIISLFMAVPFNGMEAIDYSKKDNLVVSPYRKGDTVYGEALLMTDQNYNSEIKLLYPVDEIISVKSYNLQTTYTQGTDFIITNDGKFKRTSA